MIKSTNTYKYIQFYLVLLISLGMFFLTSISELNIIGKAIAKSDSNELSEEELALMEMEDVTNKWKNEVSFMMEAEHFISTYTKQNAVDIFKKNEMRFHLNYKTGTSTIFFQIEMNGYVNFSLFNESQKTDYIICDKNRFFNNLRISGKSYELNFPNLYFNYEVGPLRFRLGNQVFNWGTTDVFNPTASINPRDWREFMFKDESEFKLGVPAFSTLFMFGNDSMEFVFVPIHIAPALHSEESFWAIQFMEGPFPVKIDRPKELDIEWRNMAIGIQFSKDFFGVDLYLTYYHGPDHEPAMRPIATFIEPGSPIEVLVEPQFFVHDKWGFALSKGIQKFSLQCEFSYSPNKSGVVEQKVSNTVTLPFEIEETHHIAYSAGINWFIPLDDWIPKHRGDSVITFEWYQSIFIDEKILKPVMADVFAAQIRDTFFNNKILLSFTTIVDVIEVGFILRPEFEYKFNFGLSIYAFYAHMDGEKDTYLGFYKDKNIFGLRVRYDH